MKKKREMEGKKEKIPLNILLRKRALLAWLNLVLVLINNNSE